MSQSANICELNDCFRKTLLGGVVAVTSGVAAREDTFDIVEMVRRFDAFNADNDPYGE